MSKRDECMVKENMELNGATCSNAQELDTILEHYHLEFAKWIDKVPHSDPPEYEERFNLMTLGKNSHGIWVDMDESNPKHISLDEAYKLYSGFRKKCRNDGPYSISPVDNTEDWNEDNEEV